MSYQSSLLVANADELDSAEAVLPAWLFLASRPALRERWREIQFVVLEFHKQRALARLPL